MSDMIQVQKIDSALDEIRMAMRELELLRGYNFNGLFGRDGSTPARDRLLDIGHTLVRASADIMRYAGE